MPRITKEKFKTYEGVFDGFTLRNLFELSGRGFFDELESPIALGKEAQVFSARKGEGRIAIKIYRLETCDFNKMYDFLAEDARYSGVAKNKRKVIFAWTQREFRNLLKAREAGIRVPVPIHFQDNLLLEEFIGDEYPAPKLKDASFRGKRKAYEDIVKAVGRLYRAGLVHGDLSEFNILYHGGPVIIDWSQAVPTTSYRAKELLVRDIGNVQRFFAKLRLNLPKTSEELAKSMRERR